MMKQVFLFTALFLALAVGVKQKEKLKITVYYESLCSDSKRFMVTQLCPLVKKNLAAHLHLDLLPYGKASHKIVDGKWVFECQHGPEECFGNKVQACVIMKYPMLPAVEFIECIMQQPRLTEIENNKQCAVKANVSWESIKECIKSGEGDGYLVHFGNRTNKISPQNVPMIWFNDKYDKDVENRALNNLFEVACEHFAEKPPKCTKFTQTDKMNK